jgi:hypothetical protein
MEKLIEIQRTLKAPKNQFNKFGNYKYRSAEDILEAAKPLCTQNGALLTLTDDVVEIGGKIFVKATATFQHESFTHSVSAFAMHPEDRKGMDASQITGASSSYARKYALNGLFCIDDGKDNDSLESAPKRKQIKLPKEKVDDAVKFIKSGKTMDELKQFYDIDAAVEKEIVKKLV